ncbi:MAG: cation diffusion facilitator family transporter [SAR324 cluster bacterium]|nr:cation diffusion facilitator family transporter [SAR324 cluster bacterium]MBL7036192.1 cation diffusion facilitator family transporter [SAR324 cluster bacterium]
MQALDLTEKHALKVTWLGLWANLLLAISKGFVGTIAHSSALIADAGHSFSDLLSDGITLWAVKMAGVPKDKNHPYGHGKFETVGTFLISLLLILTGIGVAWHVFNKMDEPVVPDTVALWMAVVAIGVKEILFHLTRMVARRSGSRVLLANAWHHRSDAISSVAALIGIGGALWGIPLMDPIAGVLVAGLIIKTGIDIGYESIRELTDETVEEEVISKLGQILTDIRGVDHYHEMRARRMGPHLLVDLHIEVDSMMSISAAHQVAERVRLRILEELPAVNEVLVHVDAEDDFFETKEGLDQTQDIILMRPQSEIEDDVKNVLKQMPAILGTTHIYCHYLSQKLNVQVNILLDAELRIRDAQKIASAARTKIEEIKDIDAADIHLELDDSL